MSGMIRMLEVAPMEKPKLIEVPHTLEVLQGLVGGTIQVVYPFADPVGLICDDEGKLKGEPANRILVDESGEPYDILVGTFYVVGLGNDDFISISDELAKKYARRFQYPEMFMRTGNGHVVMVRLGSDEPPRQIV